MKHNLLLTHIDQGCTLNVYFICTLYVAGKENMYLGRLDCPSKQNYIRRIWQLEVPITRLNASINLVDDSTVAFQVQSLFFSHWNEASVTGTTFILPML